MPDHRHNLLRWIGAIGLGICGPVVAKTIRPRFLHVPVGSPDRPDASTSIFRPLAMGSPVAHLL